MWATEHPTESRPNTRKMSVPTHFTNGGEQGHTASNEDTARAYPALVRRVLSVSPAIDMDT